MEKFKDISEFEELAKNNLQGYSMPPPADAWSAISSGTGHSVGFFSQITSMIGSTTSILKAALFASGIVAIGVVIYNENKTSIQESTTAEAVEVLKNSEATLNQDIEEEHTKEHLENKTNQTTIRSTKINNETKTPKKRDVTDTPNSDDNITTNTKHSGVVVVEQPDNKTPTETNNQNKQTTNQAPTVSISDARPCVGDAIKLSSSKAGKWVINNKVVEDNAKEIGYLCSENKNLTVEYSVDDKKVSKTIFVQSLSTNILQGKDKDTYVFSLENSTLIANWYLDGKLLAANAKSFSTLLDQVGKYEIEAKVQNHSCVSTIKTDVEIESFGSIRVANVLTPDNNEINDTYLVEISNYEQFYIQIYNGANILVFESSNPKIGWNGKEKNIGPECPVGHYFVKINYKLKGEKNKNITQKIELKR